MPNYDFLVEIILNELRIFDYKDLFLLKEIAYARNAIVFEDDLESCEARLLVIDKKAYITIRSSSQQKWKRFSIAHEIGHLEMHQKTIRNFNCKESDIDKWEQGNSINELEIEANEFAASFLLPTRFVKNDFDIDPSIHELVGIANKYQTSITATCRRYIDFCPVPAAIVWSEDFYIKWFYSNNLLQELGLFVDVKGKVVSGSTAWNIYTDRGSPKRPIRASIGDWMKSHDSIDLDLFEQSIDMRNYNGVLSLLWLEDNKDDFELDIE